jgi:hypothetical protein
VYYCAFFLFLFIIVIIAFVTQAVTDMRFAQPSARHLSSLVHGIHYVRASAYIQLRALL